LVARIAFFTAAMIAGIGDHDWRDLPGEADDARQVQVGSFDRG
jgi:hypothetical protein